MGKGLIFDIRRYSVHDGPGIRTTVFFKGCPLNCPWCHNPESILPQPQKISRCLTLNGRSRMVQKDLGRWVEVEEVMEEVLKDRLFYEESQGGVTCSGGEPLSQPAFLKKLILKCAEAGLQSTVDTSGYAPRESFLEIAGITDVLLYDIKSINRQKHIDYTGVDNAPIIENLMALPTGKPEVYIRIPVIPGFNNTMEDMIGIRDVIGKVKARVVRIDLLPFHRLGRQKYEALGMASPPAFEPEPVQDTIDQFMQVFSTARYIVKKGG